MVLLVGGYVLDVEQTTEWVKLRNISAMPADPNVIDTYFTNMHIASHCQYVFYPRPGDGKFLFASCIANDRRPMVEGYKPIEETEQARQLKQELFGDYVDKLPFLKDVEWVTITSQQCAKAILFLAGKRNRIGEERRAESKKRAADKRRAAEERRAAKRAIPAIGNLSRPIQVAPVTHGL